MKCFLHRKPAVVGFGYLFDNCLFQPFFWNSWKSPHKESVSLVLFILFNEYVTEDIIQSKYNKKYRLWRGKETELASLLQSDPLLLLEKKKLQS